MRAKLWRILVAGTLLVIALGFTPSNVALAGLSNQPRVGGPVKPQLPIDLTVSGMTRNQYASGIIDFDVKVGGAASTLYVYSQISPWDNYTSYDWGTWDARAGQVHVNFDTQLLPDGMHMVTLYTRDNQNRMLAMASLSIYVQNWSNNVGVASHFDLTSPAPLVILKGNAISVKLQNMKTNQIASFEYHLAPLGLPYLVDSTTFRTPAQFSQQVPIKGLKTGWYELTVYALDQFDQIIDKATVTVQLN